MIFLGPMTFMIDLKMSRQDVPLYKPIKIALFQLNKLKF